MVVCVYVQAVITASLCLRVCLAHSAIYTVLPLPFFPSPPSLLPSPPSLPPPLSLPSLPPPFPSLPPSLPPFPLPPGVVFGVNVIPVGSSEVQITWRQLDSRDVSGYRVYYRLLREDTRRQDGSREGETRVSFPANYNTGRVGDLEEGQEYSFEMVAVVTVSGVEREGEVRSEATVVKVEAVRGVVSRFDELLPSNIHMCVCIRFRRRTGLLSNCWHHSRHYHPHRPDCCLHLHWHRNMVRRDPYPYLATVCHGVCVRPAQFGHLASNLR